MVPGFSSVHLPSLQPRDHPPRLRGEVVEPATLFAIRVVRYRLVEREGVASRLEAGAPIGAPERRRAAPRRSAPPRLAPCLTAISTATRQDSASTPNRTAPEKRFLISIFIG